MDLAWLSLLALLLVVGVSCTGRANPGVIAIALAWAIAVYAAPWFGQSLGIATLVAGFPADLFLTLLGVSLLFTQAEANGTLATEVEEVAWGEDPAFPLARYSRKYLRINGVFVFCHDRSEAKNAHFLLQKQEEKVRKPLQRGTVVLARLCAI